VKRLPSTVRPPGYRLICSHLTSPPLAAFFEPTSNIKSLRLLAALESPAFESGPLPTLFPLVSYATPNIHELSALYAHVNASEAPIFAPTGAWFDSINVSGDLLRTRLPAWVSQEGIAQMAVNLLPVIGCVFVKSGARGVLVVQRVSGADAVNGWKNEAGKKGTLVAFSTARADEAVVLRYYPAIALSENAGAGGTVTGAGDNLAGALLASLVKGKSTSVPRELDAMVQVGMRATVCALGSREAVGDLESLSQEI
jgi:pseudouridine-5'-phosphate glycosidase/pseudouridine kinase